jgi:hypothetical protein
MIAERKGRTVNHGKEAIEMALQRIASVAKILRKGAMVMLCGRSQLNENLQGDECILQQISTLRRENRFLKVGLIFCIVIATLPYLTGFQPTVIRASKVVTERIEFVRDGKTVMSIVAHPKGNGLFIQDKNNLPAVWVYRSQYGGIMGVHDRSGKIAASICSQREGGALAACNKAGKPVAIVAALSGGGSISLNDDKMHEFVSMDATPFGGTIVIKALSGQTLWSVP